MPQTKHCYAYTCTPSGAIPFNGSRHSLPPLRDCRACNTFPTISKSDVAQVGGNWSATSNCVPNCTHMQANGAPVHLTAQTEGGARKIWNTRAQRKPT